jgi:hypothetical protein
VSRLNDYIQGDPFIDDAVKAYVAEVTVRYNGNRTPLNPATKRVKCRWVVEYQSKAQAWSNIVIMPVFLLISSAMGHGHLELFSSRVRFDTYHDLPAQAARKLKWSAELKKWLLPLAVITMMGFGFLLVVGLGLLASGLVMLVFGDKPKDSTGLDPVFCAYWIGFLVFCGIAFAAARSGQRALRKMGRPPDTDDLLDPKINVISVHIE